MQPASRQVEVKKEQGMKSEKGGYVALLFLYYIITHYGNTNI